MLKNYIKLARPHHYIKNILLFFPLIFSGNLLNMHFLIITFLGFLSFSFLSSVVYIINDIFDIEADKVHPTKCNRPIASGTISKKSAIIFAFILLFISMLINLHITTNLVSWILLSIYLISNFLYSIKLKQIPLIDIIILVSGFLIRVLYGATITNITVSGWLCLIIITVSLYLVLGKRRNELSKQGASTRKVLNYYSYEFLNKSMYLANILTIFFYILWCISKEVMERFSIKLILTLPLVLLIEIKYRLNINNNSDGDPVDVIIKDKILLLLIFIYMLIMFSIIYIL